MSTPEDSPRKTYVPLHVHSHYSVLDALSKIPELIDTAKQYHFPAMALTDNGAMFGAVEFYNAAQYAGIQPILGCDVYVIDGDVTDRSARKPLNHLTLLVKNAAGYRNLTQLITRANLEGFYYKPRCNWEMLAAHGEGLIALTSGLSGPLARPILRANPELAREEALRLKSIFGDDLYIELQDHGKDAERQYTSTVAPLAAELGIEVVITNDSRYTRPADYPVHQILLCMQEGKTIHDSDRMDIYGPEYYLKSREELERFFNHLPPEVVQRGLDNTLAVAEKITFELPQGQSILPDFPLPEGVTPEAALEKQVREKLASRFEVITPEIEERLAFELNIINQMGFPAYFLITADFIDYAREQDIPVGPGRGSAAGSLVAYVLGITDIDPLAHQLLFERFLNPERVSMPDIDIDFCIDRREQVIEYVNQKYGVDRVSQIITFGTLAARAALKAVARVMDVPFAESDRLAKMIPATPGTKLKDALQDKMPLKQAQDSDPEIAKLIDMALKLEGTVCNLGVHAAGVVISKDPLSTVVPVQSSKEGQRVATYPMGDLEKIGLLKMDFLGLRNLTIIDNTLAMVRQIRPEALGDLNIRHLPLDDEGVYAMLSAGDTDGVFQLESGGMKALVKDLRPSTFEDIGALVALYRPGPLNSGMVKQFVDRKHGRAAVSFQHPALEPILTDTYGTIVYQEQIMQIAQGLAGYTLGQADLLRRAMGKKKAEVMAKERDGFLAGCVNNAVDEGLANELFDTMSEFAAYCFNRSHSAAYAMVAYQTAFLKVHFPVEYLSALLSSVRNDLDKIQFYILAARDLGIKVLPPDVNTSGANFTPDGQNIRFGLASIKNVGLGAVEAIVQARAEKPFSGMEDFLERVDARVLNRKTLESLIQAGAFSTFGLSRRQLMNNVETLTQFASQLKTQQETGQVNLFKALGAQLEDPDSASQFSGLILTGPPDEFDPEDCQRMEKELLGFYVSTHPLDGLNDTLPLMVTHSIAGLKQEKDGSEVLIGGLIAGLQKRFTKKNKPIWIGVLEDFSGSTEFVMFSETIAQFETLVTDGARIIIQGKLQFRGDDSNQISVAVNSVRPLDGIQILHLHFQTVPPFDAIGQLRHMLGNPRGVNPVVLHLPGGVRVKAGAQFWQNGPMDALSSQIQATFPSLLAEVRVEGDPPRNPSPAPPGPEEPPDAMDMMGNPMLPAGVA
ncbi:MAG: DNA polymerase III subunit alpha [Candidatus Melainabacteria bacterium]